MGVKTCYICGAQNNSIQEHHVWMQSAGGSEGPTVPLCSTCHDLVHKQALNLESKQPFQKMFSDDLWPRAKNIVGYIQLAIRKNRNDPNRDDPYNLQLKLTRKDIFFLQLMKQDTGFTNLNKYVIQLIRGEIKKKFPTF